MSASARFSGSVVSAKVKSSPKRRRILSKQAESAPVDVIPGHHMVPAGKHPQHRVGGGHARGETQSPGSAFQLGQAVLQRLARRVQRAGIFVSLARPANSVLRICGCLIDRRHHCAVIGIGFLPGVDRKGFKFHLCLLNWPSGRLHNETHEGRRLRVLCGVEYSLGKAILQVYLLDNAPFVLSVAAGQGIAVSLAGCSLTGLLGEEKYG